MKKQLLALCMAAVIAGCGSDDKYPVPSGIGPEIDALPDGWPTTGTTEPDDTGEGAVYDVEIISYSIEKVIRPKKYVNLVVRVRNNSAEPISPRNAFAGTSVRISEDPDLKAFRNLSWESGHAQYSNDTVDDPTAMLEQGHEATLNGKMLWPNDVFNGAYYTRAETNTRWVVRRPAEEYPLFPNIDPALHRNYVESDYSNNVSDTVLVTYHEPPHRYRGDNEGTCLAEPSYVTPTSVSDAVPYTVGETVDGPGCWTGAFLYSVEMTKDAPYEIHHELSGYLTIVDIDGAVVKPFLSFDDEEQYIPSYTGRHLFYFRKDHVLRGYPFLIKEGN